MCALVASGSCTDADLYRGGTEAGGPDRLTLTGRVCTDEPSEARFPTRVAFLVDTAASPLVGWDIDGTRPWVDSVKDLLEVGRSAPELSFAVIGIDGNPALLSGPTFTRDSVTLDNAVALLRQLQPPIGAGQSRDIRAAVSLVKSLIEGDAAVLSPGELARVQYLVILMAAGLPMPNVPDCVCADPLRFPDCCFDEPGCRDGGGILIDQPTCQVQTLVDDVDGLQAAIEEAGATSLRFHAFQFLAGDSDPADGIDEPTALHDLLTQMAFAGNGTFGEFAAPDSVSLLGLDLLASAGSLDVKGLVVTNINALPTVDGIAVDSDGDGLSDGLEAGDCVDPTMIDTDGDGLTDLVDRLLGFDPCTAEPPESRPTCVGVGPLDDTDFDGLRDCEELLIGTEFTLVDTDGDVLPDRMEVVAGTRFLEPDALLDDDGDGVPNGEEVRNHTDPGSSDAGRHLGEAYRYELTNEGLQRILSAQQPHEITGVEIDSVSPGTTAGLGLLQFSVGPPATLQWRDALDSQFGPAVDVSGGGQATLLSSAALDPVAPQDHSIEVTVDEALLPTASAADASGLLVEAILVRLAERRCLRYQVRNVRLVATQAANFSDEGDNSIFVYFAESPQGRLSAPGLFRIVNIPVNFQPPSSRTPDDPILTIGDDEFVRAGF